MPDAAPVPAEIGRYRVERVLGRGAMGVIYQAHDPVIDRKVAIKLIRADLLGNEDTDDYLARFRREAQAAGRCMHPNIVAIYDCAVHEGNPFLAMEFVEGRNLGQVLAQSGPLALDRALAVIDQVLSALACAHRAGIVHRDVKPANIMLLADGRVKMTDFGIAHFDSSELTQMGSVIGTPRYMSPEQFTGAAVDARSDLYSTGVVLYEMLTGDAPFPGRNFTELVFHVVQEPAADIRTKRMEVSAGIASAIERSLAKRPEDRFASADAMAAALRQGMQGPSPAASDQTVVVAPRAGQARPAIPPDEVQSAEQRLTKHLGPIAKILVRRALSSAQSSDQFWQALAAHIESSADRQAFLAQRASPGDLSKRAR